MLCHLRKANVVRALEIILNSVLEIAINELGLCSLSASEENMPGEMFLSTLEWPAVTVCQQVEGTELPDLGEQANSSVFSSETHFPVLYIDNCELYLQRSLYAKEASTRVGTNMYPSRSQEPPHPACFL
jgi:hypothetical protein